MKTWTRIILLAVIDFIVIWFWVKQMNPDPSASIGILLLVPFVVILNLFIALILYFTKRELASLFVVNSAIAGLLMFYLFEKGIDRYQNERLESWKFKLRDTTFVITHWKPEHTFSISESTNSGSSTSFLEGRFVAKEGQYFLTTETTKYKIRNEYLFWFRNEIDSIKLTKVER